MTQLLIWKQYIFFFNLGFYNNDGQKILHQVASSGSIVKIHDLLNIGFKVGDVTRETKHSKSSNLTPLHVAISNRHADMLRLLLGYRGSKLAINTRGKEKDRSEVPMKQALRIAQISMDSSRKQEKGTLQKGQKYDEFLVRNLIYLFSFSK